MSDIPHPTTPPTEILIVEDSPTQMRRLQHILERGGYRVTCAMNGRHALDMIRQHKPSLVISDINMPEMDGFDLCRIIKSDTTLAGTPVVLVTNMTDPQDVLHSLECGADNFVVKPYEAKYLLDRVQSVLLDRKNTRIDHAGLGVEIVFNGRRHVVTSDRVQILNLLVSSYDAAIQQNRALSKAQNEIGNLNANLENIVKKRTAELYETTRRHLTLLGNLQGMAFRRHNDPDYTMEFVSEGSYTLLGVPPADITSGRVGYGSLIHPDDREAVWQEVEANLAVRTRGQYEYRMRHVDGLWRWVWEGSQGIYSDTGEVLAIEGFVADITDRKQIEADLRLSEARFRSAFDAAGHGMAWVDLEGRILMVNAAYCRIMGYSRVELLARTIADITHPDDVAMDVTNGARLSGGRAIISEREKRYIRKGGAIVWAQVNAGLVRDAEGVPLHYIVQVQDITERRQTEEWLRHAHRMEAVGQLTGGLAHDFNNLLGVIIGNLDLSIEQVDPNSETRELIDGALDSALRGADLVKQLLAFSRRQPLESKIIDLNELLADLVVLLGRTLGGNVEIKTKIAATLWRIQADVTQIESALLNLAINARDAMPKGGTLTIETANSHLDADRVAHHPDVAPGHYVMLSVSDTGTGMPPEVVERVFEPFFTTKEIGKGTGLGLSMVYGFVKQSGGHVEVYSEVGRGTSIQLYLPCVQIE